MDGCSASEIAHATGLFNSFASLRRSRSNHDGHLRLGKCSGDLADFLEQDDRLVFPRDARFETFG